MMKPFIPEETDWNLYFEPQYGGARFVGHPYQRGGNIFRFVSRVVPLIAQSPIGKELINRAADAVRAIRSGEKPLIAIKTQGRRAIKNLTGLGPRKIIRKKKKPTRQSLFIPALQNE